MVLMKPAMPYLDVIRAARERFDVPIGAYQVSGEYAMLHAAFQRGWLEQERAMMESLLSIRRAGSGLYRDLLCEGCCRAAGVTIRLSATRISSQGPRKIEFWALNRTGDLLGRYDL